MKLFLKLTPLILIICLLSLFIVSCAPLSIEQPENPYLAKNIILMIGDGMGEEHLKATKIYYGLDYLNMETLPYKGWMDTRAIAAGQLVLTDSAAAATAMATGHKTFLRWINMVPNWDLPFSEMYENAISSRTVTEIAQAKGMKTGVVATKTLNDATPAGFSSHVIDRGQAAEISRQQIASGIDVLMGAGYSDYYLPIIDSIRGAGYQIATTKNELLYAKGSKLYAGFDSITPFSEVNLEVMVQKSLEVLHNDDGFFAMFEGSKIDSYSHSNELLKMIYETLSFDIAVGIAINYVRLNPDTLLIVTADHETGGLLIPDGTTKADLSNNMFHSGGHTITKVPCFIWGPGINKLSANIDNTDIAKIIARAMGTCIY